MKKIIFSPFLFILFLSCQISACEEKMDIEDVQDSLMFNILKLAVGKHNFAHEYVQECIAHANYLFKNYQESPSADKLSPPIAKIMAALVVLKFEGINFNVAGLLKELPSVTTESISLFDFFRAELHFLMAIDWNVAIQKENELP